MTACIPTLHPGSQPNLTSVEDVMAYLFRFAVANPSETFTMLDGERLSFRRWLSTYGRTPDKLVETIGNEFTAEVSRFFPGDGYIVNCGYEKVDEITKKMTITFQDAQGNAVIPVGKVRVDAGNQLSIVFE